MILTINTSEDSYTIDNNGTRLSIDDLTKADTIFSRAVESVMHAQPLILIEKPIPLPYESN